MQLMSHVRFAFVIVILASGMIGAYAEEIGTAPVQQNDTTIIFEDGKQVNGNQQKSAQPVEKPVKSNRLLPKDTLELIGRPMAVSAGVGFRYDGETGSVDPFVGAMISLPVRYSFFHLDGGLDLSSPYLYRKEYVTEEFEDPSVIGNTRSYLRTTATGLTGFNVVCRIMPALYANRFFFGICTMFDFNYEKGNYRDEHIELVTQDTISIRSNAGTRFWMYQSLSLVFGAAVGNFRFSVFSDLGPFRTGLRVNYVLMESPFIIARKSKHFLGRLRG